MLPRSTEIQPFVASIRPSPPPFIPAAPTLPEAGSAPGDGDGAPPVPERLSGHAPTLGHARTHAGLPTGRFTAGASVTVTFREQHLVRGRAQRPWSYKLRPPSRGTGIWLSPATPGQRHRAAKPGETLGEGRKLGKPLTGQVTGPAHLVSFHWPAKWANTKGLVICSRLHAWSDDLLRDS